MNTSIFRKLVAQGRYNEAQALLRVAKRDWRETVSWDNLSSEFDRVFDHDNSVRQEIWSDILDTLDDLRAGKRQALRPYYNIDMPSRAYTVDQLVTILYAIQQGFGMRDREVADKVVEPLLADWPKTAPLPPLMDRLLLEGLQRAPGLYIEIVGKHGAKLERTLAKPALVLNEIKFLSRKAKWQKQVYAVFRAVYEVTYLIKAHNPYQAPPDAFAQWARSEVIKDVETYVLLTVDPAFSQRGDITFQEIGMTFQSKNERKQWVNFIYYTGPAVTWIAGASHHDLKYGSNLSTIIEWAGRPEWPTGRTDAAKTARRSMEMRRLLSQKTDTLTVEQNKARKVVPGRPFVGEQPWTPDTLRAKIESYGLRVQDITATLDWPRSR